MFFAIPNMEYIRHKELSPFYGLFFEHTIFYNTDNVSWLLQQMGFNILNISLFENHSLLFHVKCAADNENLYLGVPPPQIVSDPPFSNSVTSCFSYIDHVHNILSTLESDIPIYIFGACYNTQVLMAMGLNAESITGVLDNSREKQGKYLFGMNQQVYDPNILRDHPKCAVILKNGYYYDEVKEQLLQIQPNTIIL